MTTPSRASGVEPRTAELDVERLAEAEMRAAKRGLIDGRIPKLYQDHAEAVAREYRKVKR